MFCCTSLYVHSSIAIILMGKRELIALLNLSSWCLVMVERLFLAVPRGCLQFVIVVFPDHTHLLFLGSLIVKRLVKLYKDHMHSPAVTQSAPVVVGGKVSAFKLVLKVDRLQKIMKGLDKAWVQSKERTVKLVARVCVEDVCFTILSLQSLCFRYQLFKVMKGDVNSRQLLPC